MFDLHLHSQRSDGQLAPLDLAEHLIGLGFKGFSITDHNYIAADLVADVLMYAESCNVSFVVGVEVSSKDYLTGESWHVLGYGNNLATTRLNAELQPIRDGYNDRAKRIIDKLNDKYPGLALDFERLLVESGSSYLDRNRIAAELQNFKNDGSTLKELLPEVFIKKAEDWLPETAEVIQLIGQCGGLAVLAHPGRLMDRDRPKFDHLIKRLTAAGLCGLEAYYSSHTDQQTTTLLALAKKFDLLVTGGSDWHGPDFSAGKNPGCKLPPKRYAEFLQAANKKDSP